MNILVLGGGISPEHDVSERSATAVSDALKELGHTVTYYDPQAVSEDDIIAQAKQCDLALPILHGEGGEDGRLQKLFEADDIRYLGSGPAACHVTFDKVIFKQLLQENGIATPHSAVVNRANFSDNELTKQPFVLKPVEGGSSIDTFIIRDMAFDAAPLLVALEKYDTMLLEKLIEGTEVTVGVLDDVALPVIEIIPPLDKEFDYENKYNGATQELCPPKNVSPALQQTLQAKALEIHQLSGCRHLSRNDFLIRDNEIFAIDCNTMPGLTDQSLFPKAARTAGIEWNALVAQFLELSTND